ncbi:zinc-binding alcohol dehydrogenase family protein [Kitasatospora sp. NPDC058965]|uniref:quinone oxidoreductase family protein n=1 Tax=Kitasatospora sp. NPDC058965 TaxID=3346682 RepID=UPI0036BB24A1
MRAVPIHRYGGPEVLEPEQLPTPEPGPGQVRIAIEAVSVGFAQTQMRRDAFPAPMWNPTLPVVLGGDVVGTVEAVGPDVDRVRPGERVGAFLMEGAYADRVLAPAAALVPVPAELDAAEATALPGAGPIAVGTLKTGRLAPGESVLVHAAAGGIGHLSVQLAKAAGAGPVIATASSPEKLEFARSLGADVVVDYTRPDWAEQVRAATGGRGVDLILDSVGGQVLLTGVQLLAPGGRLVFYGSAGGDKAVPAVPVLDLVGLKSVVGFNLSAWQRLHPEQYAEGLAELTACLVDGRVRSAVHARLPLEQAGEGHRIIEARLHQGRVVLVP